MRVPISVKLILITAFLLLVVTVPMALVISKYFEKTSRQREENVNLDYASAKAKEVENILSGTAERTVATAGRLMKSLQETNPMAGPEPTESKTSTPSPIRNSSAEFDKEFVRDKSIIAIEIQKADGSVVARRTNDQLLKTLCDDGKCDAKSLILARQQQHFPFESVKHGQIEFQNATFNGGPGIFTVGIPLVKDSEGQVTHIAIADIALTVIQKPFSEPGERTFFAVDKRGLLLAHSDERRVMAHQDFSASEIVKIASIPKTLPRGQKEVEDQESETQGLVYAAYARTSFGVTVVSEISEEIVLEPAHQIKRQVLFIGGVVLSGALFMVFLFSLSLTSPIEKLVELLSLIKKGNFDVTATSQVNSWFRDEVFELAAAVDHMTEGLKERDKVKTLFTKFHGLSVTDDLLKNEIGLGGQRKEVLVFFSDIRGFTEMSERMMPEMVVEMLNEYFAEMVSIITSHGGVVDKFIGDAIMAIWGAPKASDQDAPNALMACLKMREKLGELNTRRLDSGKPPLTIGMGLHAGPAISGTIGSSERMEYTVIGDTVNTTSRIEASTKVFGTDLLISDEVIALVGDRFKNEFVGAVEVKGRSVPLKLHRVIGYKDANNQFVEVITPYSEYTAEGDAKVKIKSTAA